MEDNAMSIVRWEPFSDLMTLRDAMDKLFEESVVRPRGWLAPTGAAELAVDVYETENDLVVTAAVPGVKPEELEVTVTGDALSISGETKSETTSEKANFYRQERHYGAFSRTVALPMPVQVDKAEAKFKDGVLTLVLPKSEATRPRSIKINAETK
jgi:HSP20 family protein